MRAGSLVGLRAARRMPAWWRRFLALLAAATSLLTGLVAVPTVAQAGTAINGGGSSFAAPEVQQWAADMAKAPYNLTVNYQNNSSQSGRDDYAQGTYAFGASDIVYYANDGSFEQLAQTQHPFKYVTVTAGGLAFMYNIVIGGQQWTGLNLTGQEVCQIFTGQLTNWNQLASTPGDAVLASVNQPITTVVRADGAGESYVLSQYCLATDPGDWAKFQDYVDGPGAALESQSGWPGDADMSKGLPIEYWPPKLLNPTASVISASNAPTLASDVTSPTTGPFSIGYAAAVYALNVHMPTASVRNAAGFFVQPNANSVQIALSYAHLNSLGTFDLDFTGSSPQAYFPSTYSYIIAPTSTNTPDSAQIDSQLAQFLCYSVGAGQNEAAPEKYAPLSQQVTQLSVNAIESMPGAPPASQCGIGGPQPVITTGPGGQVTVSPNPTAPPAATTVPGSGGGTTTTPTAPPATTAPAGISQQNRPGTSSEAVGANPTGTAAGGASTGVTPTTVACLPTATTTTHAATTTKPGETTTSKPGESTTSKPAESTTTTHRAATKATRRSLRASTTTTAKPGATTTLASTTTTRSAPTTANPCPAGTVAATAAIGPGGTTATGLSAGGPGSVSGAPGGASSTPISVPLAEASAPQGTTNTEAYWYLLLGAVVCAVGVGAAGLRRRSVE